MKGRENTDDLSPCEDSLNFVSFHTAWESAPSRKAPRTYGRNKIHKKEIRKNHRGKSTRERFALEPLDESALLLEASSPSTSSTDILISEKSSPRSLSQCSTSKLISNFCSSRNTFRRSNSYPASSPSINVRSASAPSLSSDFDRENVNPNVVSQEETNENNFVYSSPTFLVKLIPSPCNKFEEPLKPRPRKIRAISNVSDLQLSFTDIAKSDRGGDDPSEVFSLSYTFDFEDYPVLSSPHDSVATGGSRKRGICNSSLSGDLSDISGNGGRRRSKSRSRVYSPEFISTLDTVRSLNDSNDTESKQKREQRRSHCSGLDSDENETDDDLNPCDKSWDMEEDAHSDDLDGITKLPSSCAHRASSCTFEDRVFGLTQATTVLTDYGIIQCMSSVDDLKFLIKSLKKSQKCETITFGKMTTWTVPLPNQWTSERRTKLLKWSTRELGFSMRTGGPCIVFLLVAASTGASLLTKLESALNFYGKQQNPLIIPEEFSVATSFVIDKNFCTRQQLSIKPDQETGKTNLLEHNLIEDFENLSLTVPHVSSSKRVGEFARTVTQDSDPEISGIDCPSGEVFLDLVNHIHALSPRVPRISRTSGGRRSIVGRSIVTGDKMDCKSMVCASPFLAKVKNPHSGEGLETPHMTRRAYCERPNEGSDWGTSRCCEEKNLQELMKRLENASVLGGQQSVFIQSPCFEPSPVPSLLRFTSLMESLEKESDMESANEFRESQEQVRDEVDNTSNIAYVWNDDQKAIRKKVESIAKHKRVSLCVNLFQTRPSLRPSRSSYFAGFSSTWKHESTLSLSDNKRYSFAPIDSKGSDEKVDILFDKCGALLDSKILLAIFSFLNEGELLCRAFPVCHAWADVATDAHAALMLLSVGCSSCPDTSCEEVDDEDDDSIRVSNSIMTSMSQTWKYIMNQYPHACYLAGGAFKNVYKVYNRSTKMYEAISVMDIDMIDSTGNKHIVGAELAVSAMLSSLVRRNICPNFVVTRRVFTCPYEPPKSHWGSEENKKPKGGEYSPRACDVRKPREPHVKFRARYQYMRMELCAEGDAEEYLKRQPKEAISTTQARQLLFQVAFALHAAADRFSLKHYDLKLLNIFLQKPPDVDTEFITLRYGFGSHTFSLQMRTCDALIAKIADYGTANVRLESNGLPATLGQFTTLENTPPEFMILGDLATQGHGHDAFGLGLCMLHLFTGYAPYEEILAPVKCPPGLRARLQRIWEHENSRGYSVIRSVIMADVCKDEYGRLIDGQPDGTLYDTLYRFLVLFGIPEKKYKMKEQRRVWKAISSLQQSDLTRKMHGNHGSPKDRALDAFQFERDQKEYSILLGENKYISRARKELQQVDGGLDLLFSLVDFDPDKRATVCDVLNSKFMGSLREDNNLGNINNESNHILSYMAYATG